MSTLDLQTSLPDLLPRALWWAESLSAAGLLVGAPLQGDLLRLASLVGVRRPELVRLVVVDRVPLPDDPRLRAAALSLGVLGPDTRALTLGAAVFVCEGYATGCLLAHEFRHVAQCEQAGGIAAFMPLYLAQIVQDGYEMAPLEQDACAYEDAVSDQKRGHVEKE